MQYTCNMQPKNLDLNYVVPTVTTDGNAIFINEAGDVPTLVFFQARKQDDKNLMADVVASVRMNNLTDLENFNKAIADTIRQHKNREK